MKVTYNCFQKIFGNDIVITEGGKVIGTKHIKDYSGDVSESELVEDSDLDVDTRE